MIISVVLEDTLLSSELLEVEFPIGYSNVVFCADIPITNDDALEDIHDFTLTITGAGSSPHAVLGMPTVTTVNIDDDEGEQYILDL